MKSSITHTIDGEYIREWLILGPFFPDDLHKDFLADAGGEASIEPKEGDTVTTADGKTLTWKRYESKGDIVNLLDAVGDHEYATAYAFCVLQSDTECDVEVRLGSDDGVAVWINGERVHHNPVARDITQRDVFSASMESGANRCLVKVYNLIGSWAFAMRVLPPDRAVISGVVTDEKGQPIPNVAVRLEQDGKEIAQVMTDSSGSYQLGIYPAQGEYDLSATSTVLDTRIDALSPSAVGELGDWWTGIQMHKGERRTMNLTLKRAINIEGTLLMMDDATPHVAVPVHAIRDDKVITGTLSDERGRYRFTNLKPGQYQVRCQVSGGYIYYGMTSDALQVTGEDDTSRITRYSSRSRTAIYIIQGETLRNVNFRFAPFKKGTWRNYTYLDGLPHNYISGICRDPDGALWLATRNGLSRYDGKEFVTFTEEDGLLSNVIRCIFRDRDGLLWLGTDRGVSWYDGKQFHNLTARDGLVKNQINAICSDLDGNLWFAAGYILSNEGGISRYDGKEFVNFTTENGLASNWVSSVCCDADGVLWFATGAGIYRYDGKELVNFSLEEGLDHGPYVISVYPDPDGVLWFGTVTNGVYRYDGRELINLTVKNGLVSNAVNSIYRDPDGAMWFGTGYPEVYGRGVSRYIPTHPSKGGFVNFTTRDGLVNDTIVSIYTDPDGVLWFGTIGGLSRYDKSGVINYTTGDGLPNNDVRSMYSDLDETLWFGTEGGGVSRYIPPHSSLAKGGSKGGFVNLTQVDGLTGNYVRDIQRDHDGNMWFITRFSGISRYIPLAKGGSKGGFVSFTSKDGLLSDQTFTGGIARDGTLWVGTLEGLSHYDGGRFINFTTKDGLPYNVVGEIYCDPDGVIWFGTLGGGGISRYDGKEFVSLTTKDGLVSDSVNFIYRGRDGIMWLGTNGGVSRYDGKKFVNFTTKDGLAHKDVISIYQSLDSILWFGTPSAGVCLYDGEAWSSLDIRDGLAGNAINSIHQDKDGCLWFAANRGVTRYRRSVVPPKVYIASVTTDQTYRDLSAVPAFTPGTRVTIEYDSIDFKTVPEKRQYRCRVVKIPPDPPLGKGGNERFGRKGGNSEWRKPTKATSFDFVFDEPGTYVFEVQAIDRDLNYSEPASVKLQVTPDPRNNQIARLESDLEKRNRELEEANAELQRLSSFKSELLSVVSHELRTPLTSIDGFTRLIHERFLTDDLIARCNEETRPTIQRVKDRIAIVQENTSRLARLINDLLDFSRIERGRELEMRLARIELSDVIENVIATYQAPATEKGLSLEYSGEVPLHAEELVVYGDADRLTQALSNLVSNAIKFTPEGGTITIGALKDKGMIELWVKDTGVGIPKEQLATIFEPFEQAGGVDAKKSGTGLGLAIVKHIIDRHDGTVRVESEEAKGSIFIITLPEYAAIPEVSVSRGIQRILIVDDDYDILRLLEEGLSEYPNTRIITATSSKDAFGILEQQQCDVMIADVRMPGDISGIELASQVREKYPDLKVFVMTNTPDEKERVIQMEADWIDKATPNLIHYIAKKIGRE